MPARKHRPGKHGGTPKKLPATSPSFWTPLTRRLAAEARYLGRTTEASYVGWPDMAEAEKLAKYGFLEESRNATGCFFLTAHFPDLTPSLTWAEAVQGRRESSDASASSPRAVST